MRHLIDCFYKSRKPTILHLIGACRIMPWCYQQLIFEANLTFLGNPLKSILISISELNTSLLVNYPLQTLQHFSFIFSYPLCPKEGNIILPKNYTNSLFFQSVLCNVKFLIFKNQLKIFQEAALSKQFNVQQFLLKCLPDCQFKRFNFSIL